MEGLVPEDRRAGIVEDLQSHARSLAMELMVAKVSLDSLVRLAGGQEHLQGWEVPAGEAPANKPLMVSRGGIYASSKPRIVGREVWPLGENDVKEHGDAQAIRQRLFALETKHDIFEKLKGEER